MSGLRPDGEPGRRLLPMKTKIIGAGCRYGAWDEAIELCEPGSDPKGGFDLIVVGTPPDSHVGLALEALGERPNAILVEKPIYKPEDALRCVTGKGMDTLMEADCFFRRENQDTTLKVDYRSAFELVRQAVQLSAAPRRSLYSACGG